MAYYDRHYYGDAPRQKFNAPKLGHVCKYLLGIVASVYIVLLFMTQSMDVRLALLTDSDFWPHHLLLHSYAILPVSANESWPAPWQIITATLIHGSFFQVAMVCFVTIWWFGSMVEKVFGSKYFLIFILSCAIIGNLCASVLDPLFWGLVDESQAVSFGFSHVSAAVFAAIAVLYPNTRTFLNIKLKTVVYVLLGISALMALSSYFRPADPNEKLLVNSITSLSAIAGAAIWSHVFCTTLISRGAISAQKANDGRSSKEEDFVEYAKRFDPDYMPETQEDRKVKESKNKKLEKIEKRKSEEEFQVDALLARISKEGISSLTRSERAFLERVSREKREDD